MSDFGNQTIDWVEGDMLGMKLPAHAAALEDGGADWLTAAFRASGALPADNAVSAITRAVELSGGGTGSKLRLSVDYAWPDGSLPTDLFVKFSRNFNDAIRDNARHHLASEVRIGALSSLPAFPVAVPKCMFADYHEATGTGILITETIGYGQDGLEPHRGKCMDHRLPDALTHYQALIRAIARLSGTHKAGRLGETAERYFPLDMERLLENDTNPYTPERLTNRAKRMVQFIGDYPQLFPDNLRSDEFLAELVDVAPRFLIHEPAIKTFLHARPAFIALCHWNANIDNGWYWRDADGAFHCGLMDWGLAGQMHVAMTLWGCLSGAEIELWDDHLGDLLALFAQEFAAAGGPAIDPTELDLHLELYVMMMGLAWLMDAPPRIKLEIPDPSLAKSRHDLLFDNHENARVQLKMMINFLNLWQTRDLGRHIRGEHFAPGGHIEDTL
jgi:hypothetical protein